MGNSVVVVRHVEYIPIMIGGRKIYSIDLPTDAKPYWFKTMTTGMTAYNGLVENIDGKYATVRISNDIVLKGKIAGPVSLNAPTYAIEHINVSGDLEYLISNKNFLAGNQNFANFGTKDKYIRIDIYTGDWKIING